MCKFFFETPDDVLLRKLFTADSTTCMCFSKEEKIPQENVSLCPVVILTDGKVICFYIRVVPGHNSRYIYMINYESIMLYMRAGIQYHIKAICQRCKKDDSNIFQN